MKISDIEFRLNNVSKGGADYDSKEDAYVVNYNGKKGFAIEVEKNVDINETFSLVGIKTEDLIINNKPHHFLILYTKDNSVPFNFSYICEDFLRKENRDVLIKNPNNWYESWKKLLGNAQKNKMIYDIIGELKVLLSLQKKGVNPKWKSTELGTYDIVADDGFYEVKSSVVKSSENVHISSLYQLDSSKLTKPLYLVYCKIEDTDDGDSIHSLVNDLTNNGYDKNTIIEYLKSKGYLLNSIDANKKYTIHEIKVFDVNLLPKITPEVFAEGKIPSSIINIEYTISLTGLKYTSL